MLQLSEDKVNRAVLDVDQKWRIARSAARSHQHGEYPDGQAGDSATPEQPGRSPPGQAGNGAPPQQPGKYPVRQPGNTAAMTSVGADRGRAGPSPFATNSADGVYGSKSAANDSASAGAPNDTAPQARQMTQRWCPQISRKGPAAETRGTGDDRKM